MRSPKYRGLQCMYAHPSCCIGSTTYCTPTPTVEPYTLARSLPSDPMAARRPQHEKNVSTVSRSFSPEATKSQCKLDDTRQFAQQIVCTIPTDFPEAAGGSVLCSLHKMLPLSILSIVVPLILVIWRNLVHSHRGQYCFDKNKTGVF